MVASLLSLLLALWVVLLLDPQKPLPDIQNALGANAAGAVNQPGHACPEQEAARDLFDQGGSIGLILIGMPGLEKRLARAMRNSIRASASCTSSAP